MDSQSGFPKLRESYKGREAVQWVKARTVPWGTSGQWGIPGNKHVRFMRWDEGVLLLLPKSRIQLLLEVLTGPTDPGSIQFLPDEVEEVLIFEYEHGIIQVIIAFRNGSTIDLQPPYYKAHPPRFQISIGTKTNEK